LARLAWFSRGREREKARERKKFQLSPNHHEKPYTYHPIRCM